MRLSGWPVSLSVTRPLTDATLAPGLGASRGGVGGACCAALNEATATIAMTVARMSAVLRQGRESQGDGPAFVLRKVNALPIGNIGAVSRLA
jgi:hypothetical protein